MNKSVSPFKAWASVGLQLPVEPTPREKPIIDSNVTKGKKNVSSLETECNLNFTRVEMSLSAFG